MDEREKGGDEVLSEKAPARGKSCIGARPRPSKNIPDPSTTEEEGGKGGGYGKPLPRITGKKKRLTRSTGVSWVKNAWGEGLPQKKRRKRRKGPSEPENILGGGAQRNGKSNAGKKIRRRGVAKRETGRKRLRTRKTRDKKRRLARPPAG